GERRLQLDLRLRLYSMDRLFEGDHVLIPRSRNKAVAAGGWATYQTRPWHGWSVSLGGSASFPLAGDVENDGTTLLAPGQESYSVVHQAFVQLDLGRTSLRAYRQALDTPLVTSLDNRMTPIMFEAYTAQGQAASSLSWMASYVTRVKPRNSTEFVPMSTGGGLGGDEAVSLVGATYKPTRGLTVQLWNYYCHNLMNAAYLQVDFTTSLGRGWVLKPSAQALWEESVGDERYDEISTGFAAVRLAAAKNGLDLHVALSRTAAGGPVLYPWSQNPDFTATVEEDQNLPAERAWAWGLAWDLGPIGVPGLLVMLDRTKAYALDPKPGMSQKDQYEYQAIVDYRFQGRLTGFKVRLFGAWVESSLSSGSIYGQDYTDLRAILYYNLATSLARPRGR
ncbi:MAG: OprD family porin, partial [Thermoanaerobaculaceae bacterium]|nr:OprD family porin [Thermoanaerobaculaceae bacterium]